MLETVTHNWKIRTFNCRQTIPTTKDNLWLLQKGAVKTFTWNLEGKIVTLGYWGDGDVIGQPLSKADPYEVQCLTTVQAICIPWYQSNKLANEISSCFRQTEELLCIIRTEKIYQRIYKILVWLANKFGRQVTQGKLIELPITHQELAEIIGTTRVTVTRLINQLEQDGMISRPCRRSIILHFFQP